MPSAPPSHLAALLQLAVPSVATNVLAALFPLVDAGFLGRLGTAELAAASIGNALFNAVWYYMLGVGTALDTLAAQAWGAGDAAAVRQWGWVGAAVLLALTLPMGVVLACAEAIVAGPFGQPPAVAAMTGRYCAGLIWGLPFLALFSTLQRYQQAQGRMAPSVVVGVAANVANAGLNVGLIAALGFDGSPLATSASRALSLALLLTAELRWQAAHPAAHAASAPAAAGAPPFRVALRRFLALGVPGGFVMGLEAWCFELQTMLAAAFGATALDAHAIVLSVASFTFLGFPLGVAAAASIRVGNLLGAGQPRAAKRAATIAVGLGGGFMVACGIAMWLARGRISALFTGSVPGAGAVDAAVEALVPLAACFQVFDGLQGVLGGVFRGLGRQGTIALVNLATFWAVGVPLGAWLAFGDGPLHGIIGLWTGLSAALGSACIAYACVWRSVDWAAEAHKARARSCLGGERAGDTKAQPLLAGL